MKLIIKEGESVENAIKYLQDFLEKYKNEYPILKGNMNIYITLEGFGHKDCPENEKEFILSGNGDPVDVEQWRKEKAIEETFSVWKRIQEKHNASIEWVEKDIKREEEYLATAQEKGKRTDLIEKHQKQLETNKEKLNQLHEYSHYLDQLRDAIRNRRAVLFFNRYNEKSPYSYELDFYFVFEDIDGADCYINRFGLKKGLPNGYVRRRT